MVNIGVAWSPDGGIRGTEQPQAWHAAKCRQMRDTGIMPQVGSALAELLRQSRQRPVIGNREGIWEADQGWKQGYPLRSIGLPADDEQRKIRMTCTKDFQKGFAVFGGPVFRYASASEMQRQSRR